MSDTGSSNNEKNTFAIRLIGRYLFLVLDFGNRLSLKEIFDLFVKQAASRQLKERREEAKKRRREAEVAPSGHIVNACGESSST